MFAPSRFRILMVSVFKQDSGLNLDGCRFEGSMVESGQPS